ncbi:RNA-binding protein YlmH, contains S4-like domain [Dethiosulfatibacter aminovorans DSM 17477]|uniref:RNA-binding protein YlmH, contains S4-like domain n=1 Tax=Dethiosulfatibacter aminovorans DSM 17477 TaxID=1121476 RepID=A0A1M6DKC7_9FIRM|nr:YlmH/Sll1252 family protein [Dethiosulfatibacter aminovorans]SHI73438.1 RNA-binding protein YlmH, contains S4-like domain [Dethiosulfatibacter aminovorans DSM 17477]
MKNLELYIKGLKEDDRHIARRILDIRDGAQNNFMINDSDFLYPNEARIGESVLNYFSDTSYLITGISKNAERKAIIVAPCEIYDEILKDFFTLLRGRICDVNITHRDILGALVSTGINRNKIGDIYITGEYVYVIAKKEIEKHIVHNFKRIKNISIDFESVELEEAENLSLNFEKTRIITSSMRVDNIVSNLGNMSRGKAQEFIKSGNVKLNWSNDVNRNRLLEEGDVLSLRGKGKYKISGAIGHSKKGNIVLELEKYV